MTIIDHIRRILAAGALPADLIELPAKGATDLEIAEVEAITGRPLSEQHRSLLRVWNGANFDVIRLFAAAGNPSIRLYTWLRPLDVPQPSVPVASDPAGFVYIEAADQSIWLWDHDGGRTQRVAGNLHDFFCVYVFGRRASDFGGIDWLNALRQAGLIDEEDA